jgi:hypothetical protein
VMVRSCGKEIRGFRRQTPLPSSSPRSTLLLTKFAEHETACFSVVEVVMALSPLV